MASRLAGIRPLVGDLLSAEPWRALSGEPLDAIFHFAAEIPREHHPSYQQLMTANAGATAALLDVYDRSQAQVFVYASSLPIIGFPRELPVTENHPALPLTPYHASKYAGEIAGLEFGRRTRRRVVAFRLTAPYGPGMPDSVLPRFLAAAAGGREISVYGSGSRVQNFVWADDVARASLAALRQGDGCFNLGGPSGVSMLELAELACDIAGGRRELIRLQAGPDPQEDYRFEVDTSKFAGEFTEVALTDIASGLQEFNRFLRSREICRGWWT